MSLPTGIMTTQTSKPDRLEVHLTQAEGANLERSVFLVFHPSLGQCLMETISSYEPTVCIPLGCCKQPHNRIILQRLENPDSSAIVPAATILNALRVDVTPSTDALKRARKNALAQPHMDGMDIPLKFGMYICLWELM